MKYIRFLHYPVFYNPRSRRAIDFVMEHFYSIRSLTASRDLLKRSLRPLVPAIRRFGRKELEAEPEYEVLLPYLAESRFGVIVDARRFFRLIDFNSRTVISISKENDLPDYFENEIYARRKLVGLDFMPELLEVNEDRKYFIEEYVCEIPLKSCSLSEFDPYEFTVRIKEILSLVHAVDPVRVVSTREYVEKLSSAIRSRPDADREIIDYIEYLEDRVRGLPEVELVFSHGDLRKDQIFFAADGTIKIIDWECSGGFSRHFDIMELFITEKWLYDNPAVSLESLLGIDRARMEEFCYLYLLEVCHFPIRFRREFQLTRSVPIIKNVEALLLASAFRGG